MFAPLAIMWVVFFPMLWKYHRAVIASTALALIVGIPWDIFALKAKIWGWPDGCCSLPAVAGLPLEELLWIIFAGVGISTITLIIRDTYLKHRFHAKRR